MFFISGNYFNNIPAVQPTFDQIIEIFGITSPGGLKIYFIKTFNFKSLQNFIIYSLRQQFKCIFIAISRIIVHI